MSTIACRLGRSHLEAAAGQGGSQKFLVQFIAPPVREGGSTLNTSFIERLNLTIRQGSAYLCRKTICQARWRERLEGHLELLRCYYNVVRPHRALKFGRELRTPAIQAGLTGERLTFRKIFCSVIASLESCEIELVSCPLQHHSLLGMPCLRRLTTFDGGSTERRGPS
jgi:hypothetical protein